MTEENNNLPIKPAVIDLLTRERFSSMFGDKLLEFNNQIQAINEMEITDPVKHEEAELKLKIIKNSIDFIKSFTEKVLQPYDEILKECKEYSNDLIEKIQLADKDLRDKIITFQKLNANKVSGSINEDYEDKKRLINNTIVLNEKVNILCKQIYARLRGGLGPKLDGTTGTFSGVHSTIDAENFISFINEKFPNPDQFGEFSSMIQYAKNMGIKIAKWFIFIYEKQAEGKDVSGCESDLEKMFNTFNLKCDGDYVKAKNTLERKLKKNDDEYNKNIKSLTKGIIYKWDYTIDNSVMVPEEFKSVDDKKIKAFINDNKEDMDTELIDTPNGKTLKRQPIPGLIFFKKEQKRIT